MNKALRIVSCFLLGFGPGLACAQATGEGLDQRSIHEDYNEGEFELVTEGIDRFAKSHRVWSRSDSIFIAKHLAVVFTARSDTREKGKYYMHRLLELMPSAELVDMFVSDEVDRIFEKVRKEFSAMRAQAEARPSGASDRRPGTAGFPDATPPVPGKKHARPFWKRKTFWIVGGSGAALAGAIVGFWMLQRPGPGESIPVPSPH